VRPWSECKVLVHFVWSLCYPHACRGVGPRDSKRTGGELGGSLPCRDRKEGCGLTHDQLPCEGHGHCTQGRGKRNTTAYREIADSVRLAYAQPPSRARFGGVGESDGLQPAGTFAGRSVEG